MPQIGAKVYYDKKTGDAIQEIGERSGDVVETSREHDFEVYANLAERVPDTVGMIQFDYKEHEQDREAGGYITRIDLETMEPLFVYPDPTDPGTPQEPRPALSTQVSALETETAALNLAVIDLWETIANGGAA